MRITGEDSVTLEGLEPGIYSVTEDRNSAEPSEGNYYLVNVTVERDVEVVVNGNPEVIVINRYNEETTTAQMQMRTLMPTPMRTPAPTQIPTRTQIRICPTPTIRTVQM